MKIKVCHIATVDLTVRFLLLNQLKYLQDNSYEIHAICSSGNWIKEINDNGICVKTIRMKRAISPFSDLVALWRIYKYLKKEKIHIVHTHTPKAILLGQLAAKFARVPIIITTIHGFYFHDNMNFLLRKFYVMIERVAALCADSIFSQNSEDIKTAIDKKICKNELIQYLGNGIDIEKFNLKNYSKEFIKQKKEEIGIAQNKKVIGIVGRLVKEKGFIELFEAFKIVRKNYKEILLLVVGPIDYEKKDVLTPDITKKYDIENDIIFLGFRSDMPELYSIMDLFVLPSYREGFPRSILEASAMAKPVIATDVRGCREAVEGGNTGILVPVKNSKKLADAILYILNNPKCALKIGLKGREKAEREFNDILIYQRIQKEYKKLILRKNLLNSNG